MGVTEAGSTKEPRTERSGSLTLEVRASEDSVVLGLVGELDLACAELLRDEINAAEASNAPRIIVDLSGLEFVDSTGLEVLVRAHQRSQASSHQFEIRGASGDVARILELTGLIGFLG